MSTQDKFQQVKKLVDQGDCYRKDAKFQSAAKAYKSAAAILRSLAVGVNKPETLQLIQGKIKKYEELAKEMMQKAGVAINRPSKITFGFPEVPNYRGSLPIKQAQHKQIKNRSLQNNAKKVENDPEVQGLIAKNIQVSFSDIVGMAELKQALYEAVIIPQKRPDLFKGIRSPPRGILLYGPPGNGKTFITKALAKQSGCTFFGLSAGSIMNKFVGQSEKMLKRVFEAAKKNEPSIIFIDEIDSMLTARSQSDNDSARRLKTQFLVQFDNLQGVRVILIGATNLPNELDLAALRRFNKLVYVGLPDKQSRKGIVQKTLSGVNSDLSNSDMTKLVKDLDGYSASEITDIVKEACMMPIRDISKNKIETVDVSKIRAVKIDDFVKVIKGKKPLLSKEDLKKYQGKFK